MILLGQATRILGGFARAIAEYSVKTSQSNKVERYKYLSSEVPDRAIMRLKCYWSIMVVLKPANHEFDNYNQNKDSVSNV